MEVLSSYAPAASPYSSPRSASSSSSTLDYRSSRQGLDLHSELALSVDHAVFIKFHGDSLRTGVSVPHGARRSSPSPRTFAPLTPIIASPITTPSTSISTNALYLSSDNGGAKEKLIALQHTSHHEQGYFIKDILPPTPADGEKVVGVIDKSPTWTSTPPTPPPKSPRYRSGVQRASSSVVPSASFPVSLNPHGYSSRGSAPRRRASLPPMALSKTLPPHPPSPSLKIRQPRQSKQSRLSGSPLRGGAIIVPNDSGRSSPKPIFHVLDSGSEREDDGSGKPLTDSPKEMFLEQEMAPSASESGWLKAKGQDDIRRYHALTELLTTEEGYLLDLRELVNGYIRHLPTLSCRSIANSSSNISISPFTRSPTSATFPASASSSNSRTPSHSHLALASQNPSLTFSEGQGASTPSKDKNATRYMFSNEEVELVTRNIEEILHFHEDFVDELRTALMPLGFFMSSNGSEGNDALHIGSPELHLEAAIEVVSKMFTRQAASFDLYETFCAGHPEAFDLVRKLQRAHAVEWDAFEQRSSQLVANLRKPVSYIQTLEGQVSIPALDDTESFEVRRKRRHSLSSLDFPARSLRVPNMRSNTNLNHAATTLFDLGAAREKNSRLVFMDYLIKPVQRICRYPLLLDQLKMGTSFRRSFQEDGSSYFPSNEFTALTNANSVVEIAAQAMRHVASSVDEARRRQDISTKSTLIAARISNAFPGQPSSSLRSPVGHNLSPVFLSSLGACLLAGSLDVIHHYLDKIPGSSGTVKAKYLGAFLYMGGYLILAKVAKGKVYEPRHWLSLAGVELVDVPEEEALLPCSFRLSCKGHHLDMAAACQREKDVWISAFRESVTLPSSWSNEPASSLQAHGRSDFFLSMFEDGPCEGIPPVPPLPTIQSIPELEGGVDTLTPAVIRIDTALPRGQPRQDSVNLSLPPSRRSSTASVKAIFSPVSESTILIRRASPPARQQVERGLHDVFSDLCLSARYHANVHEEELFQAPKVIRSAFSRSSSGLGMAGMGVAAKNRLTKRESVLVQRRTSGIDGYLPPLEGEAQMEVLKRASTTKSLASRRQAKKLKIVSVPPPLTSEGEGDLADTAPALSRCSSATASNAGSVADSPIIETMPSRAVPIMVKTNMRPDLLVVGEANGRPKRSRSMVENVKSIFRSRSLSPASSLLGDHSLPPSPEDLRPQWNASLNSGLLKRLSGTLRRRARSAPDVPEEIPLFTSRMYSGSPLTATPTPPITVRRNKATKERRPVLLSTSESGQLRAYTTPEVTAVTTTSEVHFQQNPSPTRRRSLFSSTISRRHYATDEPVSSLRLQRNFSFLQRLSPLTATMTISPH